MPGVARVSESPITAYVLYWGGEPQGIEGRQVLEATRAVQRHLKEPASSLLVFLLTKLALNSSCVLGKPLTHLLVVPHPFKGVGIPMVIFWP